MTDRKTREVPLSRFITKIYICTRLYHCVHYATALHSALPPRSSDKSKRRHHTLYRKVIRHGGETSELSLGVHQITLKSLLQVRVQSLDSRVSNIVHRVLIIERQR